MKCTMIFFQKNKYMLTIIYPVRVLPRCGFGLGQNSNVSQGEGKFPCLIRFKHSLDRVFEGFVRQKSTFSRNRLLRPAPENRRKSGTLGHGGV
jgi:hypothetical protein